MYEINKYKMEKHVKGYLISIFFIASFVNASEPISTKYTIDSDRQLILPNGDIKAIGHVYAVSGDITIHGPWQNWYWHRYR